MSFQIRMNYPRRWAMIFWITAVLLVWLITYAVRQGELLLAEQRATAEIATWLATTSSAEARVMAEAPIAGRPHLPLPHAANLAQTRPWLTALQQTQPEWVVGDGSIGWQFIAQTAWFTSHYTVAYERPPYTVWQRTAEPLPPLEPLALDIGGQTTLVGSYISPTVIQTGQEVAVTLAFSATQTLSRTFTTHLELRSGATVVASTSQTNPHRHPLGLVGCAAGGARNFLVKSRPASRQWHLYAGSLFQGQWATRRGRVATPPRRNNCLRMGFRDSKCAVRKWGTGDE